MDQQDFEALYPTGKEVELDDGLGVVVVLPIGIRHIFPIQDAITKIVSAALSPKAQTGDGDNELIGAVAASVLPILMTDAFDIVRNSTVVAKRDESGQLQMNPKLTLDSMPHWHIPSIIEAWTDLNFGEEKKRSPWIRVLEKAITRMTKKTFKLSEFLSEISSKRAIRAGTSSTSKDETVVDGASPIEDGPSLSSPSGETLQPEPLSGA